MLKVGGGIDIIAHSVRARKFVATPIWHNFCCQTTVQWQEFLGCVRLEMGSKSTLQLLIPKLYMISHSWA